MSRLLAFIRSARSDFANVFGRSPAAVLGRLSKGLRVLSGMIRGHDVASTALPVRLQIEVTDRCNFDCIMCNRLTRPGIKFSLSNDVSAYVFSRLLDEIHPYYVTLNGLGEPTLHKQIDRMLIDCRSRGIRSQMPTNLSLPDPLLNKVAPNPPGVLTFSMHGASKESFEAISVHSKFESCIDLFEQFLGKVDRKQVEIRVLCALQAKNLHEYDGFFDYLNRWGLLDRFVLLPVNDLRTGPEEERRIFPTADEIERTLSRLDSDLAACHDAAKLKFLNRWRETILAIRPAEQVVETGPCLVPWFSTYITARGNVLPCCYLTDEDHVLGNIHEESFAQIWNGPRYREFRRKLRDDRGSLPGCRSCPRNDADRLRAYNPLSLVPSKWNLADTPTRNATPAPAGPTVPLTIGGKPVRSTTSSSA